MAVNIRLKSRAVKSADKLEKSDRRISDALSARFAELRENPLPPGAKLVKGAESVYSIPFHGDYGRIIYRIVSEEEIHILLVGSREEVYRRWRHFIG